MSSHDRASTSCSTTRIRFPFPLQLYPPVLHRSVVWFTRRLPRNPNPADLAPCAVKHGPHTAAPADTPTCSKYRETHAGSDDTPSHQPHTACGNCVDTKGGACVSPETGRAPRGTESGSVRVNGPERGHDRGAVAGITTAQRRRPRYGTASAAGHGTVLYGTARRINFRN